MDIVNLTCCNVSLDNVSVNSDWLEITCILEEMVHGWQTAKFLIVNF